MIIKRKSIAIIGVALFVFAVSCKSTVPVRVLDYTSEMGGKNIKITRSITPITYDGQIIKGLPSGANTAATALVYKDEDGKSVTKYSNRNTVELGHIEMWEVKKDFINMEIGRYFYKSQRLMACLSLGGVPPYIISDTVYMTVPASPFGATGEFGSDFVAAKPIETLLIVSNTGTMPQKDEFVVADVLPDYFEFMKAEYSGPVKEVAYDIHVKGKNQIIVFKVRPKEKGFAKMEAIELKITAKPVMEKFKAPEYKAAE